MSLLSMYSKIKLSLSCVFKFTNEIIIIVIYLFYPTTFIYMIITSFYLHNLTIKFINLPNF